MENEGIIFEHSFEDIDYNSEQSNEADSLKSDQQSESNQEVNSPADIAKVKKSMTFEKRFKRKSVHYRKSENIKGVSLVQQMQKSKST